MPTFKVKGPLAYLEGLSDKELAALKAVATYHDKSAEFDYKKFRKNRWFAAKYGDVAFQDECDARKAAIKQCLVKERDGVVSTYAGLLEDLQQALKPFGKELTVVASEDPPEYTPVPWKKQPPLSRPYQKVAVERLMSTTLGAIEYGTGLGKSIVIANLVRNAGLKAIVMAPSRSIGNQLYDTLRTLLGDAKVGFYGDGKKVYQKLVTVGIAASLTKLEPGTPAYEELSKAQVFITDESHFLAADTFEKVAMGVAKAASYRWSVSGTQTRGDGAEMLLKGLTGPIVAKMTVKEGVDQGYLAKPVFTMYRVPSPSSYWSEDANDMTRVHLYKNPAVSKAAGSLAATLATKLGQQVVVLVDEVEQFTLLLPYLPVDQVRFAHGGLNKDNRGKVPQEFHQSDPKELVRDFNERKFSILVGTSCIATGTDILPVDSIIYLVGGKSFIGASQAVGRGTRLVEGKTQCNFIDFMPLVYSPANGIDDSSDAMRNWSVLKHHAVARLRIYDSIYGPHTLV